MHSQEGGRDDVLAHVASNLRALRHAAGLSQQEVAERAGLSRRMIVGLEGGETNISLAKLSLVATALGVSFPRIVQPPVADERADGALVWRGAMRESRAAFLDAAPCMREAEFWFWTIAPGDRYAAEADPPGYSEAVFVTEGTLTLEFEKQEKRVSAGGFIRYTSDQAYSYVNRGDGPVRFLRTVLS